MWYNSNVLRITKGSIISCLILSIIIQLVGLFAFWSLSKSLSIQSIPGSFHVTQLVLVILFSTGISILNFISISSLREGLVRIIVVFLKSLSLFFVCLGVGTWENLYTLLLVGIVIETCALWNTSTATVLSISIFAIAMYTLQPHITNDIYVEGIPFREGLKTAVIVFCAGSFTVLVRQLCLGHHLKEKEVQRLENAVKRIADTNLAYQNYATTIKEKSIKDECHRITSEIHDIIGYTMTNALMLVQAALHAHNSAKKHEFLIKAQKHISESVDEARLALRRMREWEVYAVSPCTLYAQLVKMFSEITGIAISIDFGNVSSYINPESEKAIYRFLQEGMTNSFRHGKSNSIDISFRYENGFVTVRMIDDGCGSQSEEIHEGIGIKGMRERLENLDGKLIATAVTGGFLLQAIVPGGEVFYE